MDIKLEDILAIVLLIIVSALLGCQFMNKRTKRNKKPKVRYTCGIEGGCEISMNGPYESKEECESSCGNAI